MDRLIKLALNLFPRKFLIRVSYLFRWFSRFLYRGNNVECPVCGSHYRKFLGYGYHTIRKNALCPKCMSLERHRLQWLYLENKTGFFTDSLKVLHVAPEQPFLERFRKLKNLDYTTADLESPIADVKCDIQELPFGENIFDAVICNHVLEHVDDDTRAMSEILRVLKPGGFALLSVPLDFSLQKTYENTEITTAKGRAEHFKQYDHQRLYGLDYPERLRTVGFQMNEKNYLEELSDAEKQRYALPTQEFMYGYRKPESAKVTGK